MSIHQIHFGPFSIEDEPARLMCGADPIQLRPKSLEVLKYLAKRPGQLVSKEELLRRVWTGRVISDSGLRLCVREIRAALGDNADKPLYLETVVGRGYRFLEGRDGRAIFPDTTGPIVGRESELRQLEDYYQLAADGHSQFVLLGGEPGIGKTTLLNSFLDRILEQSTPNVVQAQCVVHFGKSEAYGPLLDAMAHFGSSPNAAEVLKVLKRFAPTWLLQMPGLLDPSEFERLQSQVSGVTPERMTREFCQAVEELAKLAPLIIVIEDLHWADVSTMDLLAMLTQHPGLSKLLILGTYRPADAVIYAEHLRDIVHELKVHRQCEEMMLEFLSQEDVTSYLMGRLDGDVSTELSTKVFRRTNGNPLFMVTLIEDFIRQQILVQREGRWTFDDQAQNRLEGVPETLRSLILRRLEALPIEQRQILEAASVAGIEFTNAATASALEQPAKDIDDQCEAMVEQGQFIEAIGLEDWPDGTISGHYRFQHPLYLEVLYEQIGDARKAGLHRLIGNRLEKGYGDGTNEIAAELANHFDQGGDIDRAIRYRDMAAEQALNRHAYPEAIQQLRHAVDTLQRQPQSPERDRLEVQLLLRLGPALIAIDGYASPEVEKDFLRARALCERLEDKSQNITALWNLAGFHMARTELGQSRSLIEQVVELAKEIGDDDLDLMADDALAQQSFFEGKFDAAYKHCETVISRYDPGRHKHLAERYSQEDPGVICAGIDALVSWLLGFPDRSADRMHTLETLSGAVGNPYSTSFAWFLATIMYQSQRDLQATGRLANDLIQLSNKHALHWIAPARILLDWVKTQQTAGAENLEQMKEDLNTFQHTGQTTFMPYFLGLLAETQQVLGRVEDAQASVAEALSMVEKSDERWCEAELHRLQGELMLQQDVKQHTEAVKCFRQALQVAREQQAKTLELRAALSLSRLCIQSGQSQEARKLLEPIFSSFTEGLDTKDLQDAKSLLGELV